MPDVAGGGHVGIALESTRGTYEAPSVFAPVISESLDEKRNDPTRKPIVGQAVTLGKVSGRSHVEGDITIEAMPLVLAYFFGASRWQSSKTGAGPYEFVFSDGKDAHVQANDRSLSIAIDRAGIGFAYLGCQMTNVRFFQEDGIPYATISIIGLEETNDYTPGAVTIPTEVPFNADDIALTIAAGARTDIDTLEFNFNDNGEARFNLSGNEGADYVKFGEFEGMASFEVDFDSKADYAIWEALTTQEMKAVWTRSANQIMDIEIHGGPYNSFEVGMGAMGDQVRASAELMAAYVAGDTAAVTVTLTSATDIAEIT